MGPLDVAFIKIVAIIKMGDKTAKKKTAKIISTNLFRY
ncbi:unnamed protein product, partial [marine sediment metagenome]